MPITGDTDSSFVTSKASGQGVSRSSLSSSSLAAKITTTAITEDDESEPPDPLPLRQLTHGTAHSGQRSLHESQPQFPASRLPSTSNRPIKDHVASDFGVSRQQSDPRKVGSASGGLEIEGEGEEGVDYDEGNWDQEKGGMSRRQSSRLRARKDGTGSAVNSRASTPISVDGYASLDGDMNSNGIELRKKRLSLDTEQRANLLMSRESFTLDEDVPAPLTPGMAPASNLSFHELPRQDQRNFLLLVLLYFLQGIPMGLAGGSVPFLLKSHLSYGQIGIFSLASYPYSLKLLWSPIVDAVWSPKIGRRKSWILPIQLCSGMGLLYLGGKATQMMLDAAKDDGSGVWVFTAWWFGVVFMCATQDIAVDGWALTLLSQNNLSYASTAQTVGLTAGHFMSYTVFLAFNSADFANRWFRSTPQEEGLITLGGYLAFWGWVYILVTIGLAILKKEEKTRKRDGIIEVYRSMWQVLKLRNIHTIIIIHLIAKIGFQANDAVTNLKLLDKGFSQEDLALTVLIDFPFEIALGYYVGSWSNKYEPMNVWCWGFMARLVAAIFAQFVVAIFPAGGTTGWYLFVVIIEHIYSTFSSTVMFVAISAFHARIADPVIGGTYMTLLATMSNLGGTFPKFFVLKLVDMFTVATCEPFNPEHAGDQPKFLKEGSELITQAFSCALEADKHRCIDGGGTCTVQRDGYNITNVVCVIFGVVTFFMWIGPAARRIQALPLKAWRVRPENQMR